MKKVIFILAALLVSQIAMAEEASLILFKEIGFQIQPLEAISDTTSSQPLIMMLPPSNGFAPNVNIMIQPYKAKIEQYKEITERQLQQAKFKSLTSKIDNGVYVFEYLGKMSGGSVHVYSKAHQKDGHVYLITATDIESQWNDNKDKLLKAVDSFRFIK